MVFSSIPVALFAVFLPQLIHGQNVFLNSAADQIALKINTATTPTVNIFTVQLAGTDELYVDSSGDVFTAGPAAVTSDRRLKESITTIESALETVTALRGVRFRYINNHTATSSSSEGEEQQEAEAEEEQAPLQLGFIAQEAQAVEPTLVSQPKSGSRKDFLHMNYAGVTPLLVEAVKELRTECASESQALRAELAALREEIQNLKSSAD